MSVKSKVAVVIVLTALGAGVLAAAGFWRPDSPRYWRAGAQAALFFVADTLPASPWAHKPTEKLAKAALRVHVSGVSEAEFEKAATLLDRAGAAPDAATLWLGLANLNASLGNVHAALASAEKSLASAHTEAALVALVILSRGDDARETGWLKELRAAFPEHELSHVKACVDQTQSLAVDPPGICGKVDWVGEIAWHARREQVRIDREIEELPQKATSQIAENEARIQQLSGEQLDISRTYHALGQEKSSLGWKAAGEVFLDVLPLPKPNDTLERFAVREVTCALRYLRIGCLIGAIAGSFDRMAERERSIEERTTNLSELYHLNENLIGYARRNIAEWRSSRPLERLVRERAGLLAGFRESVTTEIERRYSEPGVHPSTAIQAVLIEKDLGTTASAEAERSQSAEKPRSTTHFLPDSKVRESLFSFRRLDHD